MEEPPAPLHGTCGPETGQPASRLGALLGKLGDLDSVRRLVPLGGLDPPFTPFGERLKNSVMAAPPPARRALAVSSQTAAQSAPS